MSAWKRLALALTPLSAGIVAGIVLLAVPHRGSRSSCLHAPVPAAARRALAAYAGRIEYQSERASDGSRERAWSDPRTGDERHLVRDSNGRVQEFAATENGTIYEIFFSERSYIVDHIHVPGSLAVASHGNVAALLAQMYRDGVFHHSIKVVGHSFVDGRRTVHLRRTTPAVKLPPPRGLPAGPSTFPATREDASVDPLTYLPLQVEQRSGGTTTVTRTVWLARTPANVMLTRPLIPRGFKRMPPSSVVLQTGSLNVKLKTKIGCAQ